MADQILSQEEIDALLSAMDSGEVEVEEEPTPKSKVEARPYDLTSQSLMLRDQFDALDEVYDKFVNLLNVPLLVLMFVGEYAYRVVRYREFPHVTIVQAVRAFARHGGFTNAGTR